MVNLDLDLIYQLTSPGSRLPWIKKWLIDEVWSLKDYEQLSHNQYLLRGEEAVNKFELLIASSADRVYREFLASLDPQKNLFNLLNDNKLAIVVFDGLSLREIPIILKLAQKSGFNIKEVDCSHASIPCETIDFIDREFGCGRVAPSQLPNRSELKKKNIYCVYTNNITQSISIEDQNKPLIVWSSFPDHTYKDSGAKFENHFENIHVQFETSWMNTVQQIKEKDRIIITSDHGYVFFGTGMDFPRSQAELRDLNSYFGNDRNALLSEKPDYPKSEDVIIDENRGVAMVKGRVRTRSTGEAATKLYKHGGLSLMEMLTPWVVLET